MEDILDTNSNIKDNLDLLKKAFVLNNQVNILNDDGFYCLDKDYEAIALYEEYVNKNFGINLIGVQKIKWLIENQFYVDDLIKNYTDDEVQRLIDIVYDHPFKWNSFMGIIKFYQSYVLKTDDGKKFLERFQDRVIIVSLFLIKDNIDMAIDLALIMMKRIYQPATPAFSNAGKKRSGELISCFLLEMDDSINSINYNISTSMQLSKLGGGVAINLSKLRAKGASIKNISAAASGIIPVLKILENVFDYADQLGVRRGSGAAYLNIFHHDLIDFIDCKKINSDEKSRLQTLSLGLLIPDKFFELAKNNDSFYVFEPNTIHKKYGMYMDEMDMNQWYDVLINDSDIMKSYLSARYIINKIAQSQFESGYPYLIFIDTANKNNPLKNCGRIKMSNLCTEIFQIQETSFIDDYTGKDIIKNDVSCTLGSLNIVNLFKNKNWKNIIYISMQSLTSIVDLSHIKNAPGIQVANQKYHSVGLGVMNFTGFLIKNNIPYESLSALEFADVLFSTINYYSLLASCNIAKERNKKFADFEKSDYFSGEYFKKYFENDYLPKNDNIKILFDGIKLPTKDDWKELSLMVKEYGLYHAYRLAIAPTQTISYLSGATASISPIITPIETRMYGNSITYFPMPFLSQDNIFLYKSAYNMDQTKIIDMAARIQPHIDQGISTILYVTSNTSTRDLCKLYVYAWHKNLKSLYYTRTKNLEIHECLSCAS